MQYDPNEHEIVMGIPRKGDWYWFDGWEQAPNDFDVEFPILRPRKKPAPPTIEQRMAAAEERIAKLEKGGVA